MNPLKQKIPLSILLWMLLVNLCACTHAANSESAHLLSAQQIAICSDNAVWLVRIANGVPQPRTKLFDLPTGATSCPRWSPKGNRAFVPAQIKNNDSRAIANAQHQKLLYWFDGDAPAQPAPLSEWQTLSELDWSYTPHWQANDQPTLAVVSVESYGQDCTRLDLCRNINPEAFLHDPDGTRTQLTQMNQPLCTAQSSAGGLWVLLSQGNCAASSYKRTYSVVRVDTGLVQSLPISPMLHSLVWLGWSAVGEDKLLIAGQRRGAKNIYTDLFAYIPSTQQLEIVVSGIPDFEGVLWMNTLANANAQILYVTNGEIWQADVETHDQKRRGILQPQDFACEAAFELAHDDSVLLQYIQCGMNNANLVWIDMRTGSTDGVHQVDVFRSLAGSGTVSDNGEWVAVTSIERTQGTIKSRATLLHLADQKTYDLGLYSAGLRLHWVRLP